MSSITIKVEADEGGVTTRNDDEEQAINEVFLEDAQNSSANEDPLQNHPANCSNTMDEKGKRISPYNKLEILKCLMTLGCSSWSTAEAISRFSIDPEVVIEFFNEKAKLAQHHVGEECGSLCFENVNAWLSFLEDIKLHEFCDFEPALITKAIADNEEHPSPEELGGIDLKSIYKFLGNALMGLPQTELNTESAKFLSDEFEALIFDVNTRTAEDHTKAIKDILNKDCSQPAETSKLRGKTSLDPLGIDGDITKFL